MTLFGSKGSAGFTCTGVIVLTLFLSMTSFLSVSLMKTFPSLSVTVTVIPFENVVGGTTIQNWVALFSVFPSLTLPWRVIEVLAVDAISMSGLSLTAGVMVASPERSSPFRPSSLMDLMVRSELSGPAPKNLKTRYPPTFLNLSRLSLLSVVETIVLAPGPKEPSL